MVIPPVEPMWSLAVICETLRISRQHCYRLIKRAGIMTAHYGRDGSHPRRRRLFTREEFKAIAGQRWKRTPAAR